MSALTKEEREFLDPIRVNPTILENEYLAIIDRLVAENEELRKDVEAITRHGMRLEAKLTTLIEAAGPFTSLWCKGDHSLPNDLVIYYDSDKTAITVGDVRNLNKAVKEAKDGK